jgi:hypothetical protein
LLRREGIYHSQLQTWRAQLAASGSNGLHPQRPAERVNPFETAIP